MVWKWKTQFVIHGIKGNKYSQIADCNKWYNQRGISNDNKLVNCLKT